jgi:hypothetical protein
MRSHRTARTIRSTVVAFAALTLSASVAVAAVLAPDLTGTWDFAVVTENGTGTPTVTLKQEGTALTGTYESRMLGVRALKGTVKGDSLKFDLAPAGDANVVLSFAGVIVDADHVKGTVDFGGMGGATFTGERKK